MRYRVAILLLLSGTLVWTVSRPEEIPFEKHAIDLGGSETCAFADVNGDGKLDIISGENWFEAPADPRSGDWKFHPEFELESPGFMYVLDVNSDGRNDIVTSLAHNYAAFIGTSS